MSSKSKRALNAYLIIHNLNTKQNTWKLKYNNNAAISVSTLNCSSTQCKPLRDEGKLHQLIWGWYINLQFVNVIHQEQIRLDLTFFPIFSESNKIYVTIYITKVTNRKIIAAFEYRNRKPCTLKFMKTVLGYPKPLLFHTEQCVFGNYQGVFYAGSWL